MDRRDPGWSWFEAGRPVPAETEARAQALARSYARTFSGPDGEAVLAHLVALTQERCLGPEASDAALRTLEGQRLLVAQIRALAERGRAEG